MIVRRSLLLLLLASCVSSAPPDGPPVRGPTPGDDGELVVPVAVVNAMQADPALGETFVDGMRLAAREVNGDGGIAGARLELSVAPSFADALDSSVATLVVGPGPVVAADRASVERDGDPVLLLGGDLYSSRGLIRQVFQVSPPLAWQATALARYLVLDRAYEAVTLVTEPGPAGAEAGAVFEAAWEEEGSAFAEPGLKVDANVFADAPGLVGDFGAGPDGDQGQLVATGDVLALGPPIPSGAVASYPYTWAGWADPIPRVHRFRVAFERFSGRLPDGFEQEGYDAVHVLAAALDATNGQGGDALVHELESVSDATFSSLPIALGPDDHLFAGRGQIGIFARLAPNEIDDVTSPTGVPWAPLMRTFTYNGRRTSIVDRDKDVFFPGWERREPAPNYQRSAHGITTSSEDPLH
jgi:hypothetical protein